MADKLDADKLAVLAALLAKEEERRFKEKFEKGEEVVIVTGCPDADDDEGKVTLKADKAPSADDFSARRQVSEALSAVAKPMPSSPPPRPQRQAEVERPDEGPHRIIAQIRAPDYERGDQGEVAEGTYSVYGNVVHVDDMEGRSLGGQVLRPEDNPASVARAILRTTKAPGQFWAPINYTTH
jgi:hypothetical protein